MTRLPRPPSRPQVLDGKRDQNSLILAHRRRFSASTVADVTQRVLDGLGGAWAAPGDLLIVAVEENAAPGGGAGRPWLLASFHGDSDGLSSVPLLQALAEVLCRGVKRY